MARSVLKELLSEVRAIRRALEARSETGTETETAPPKRRAFVRLEQGVDVDEMAAARARRTLRKHGIGE